ncbi:Cro/Cl family transcriptional regulator [Williamsia sp. 1138]|uniref:Helix-turn-helix transcriptional regulator n=1 Tax=Gordonia rubripertincta TaxID=36822 RepID=A0ABT4MUS7_GORRU|nr:MULTISPECIES: helix-turn-helix transcriptional regulator [Mycobacteriales]MCZ4550746.1 helix-turn-helix transcriptional regulator [Gordonia rubripertincta]OZG30548.1 Cro/Cl family transcriptional regulator [Williamsia sp. 1138]
MRRTVDYTWRLSELMAAAGMHNSTDLVPHLRERGIDLSASQVYRLVAQKPERVSLTLIAAVCDIFTCTPADLVTVTATDQRRKKTASAEENVLDLNRSARPRRARVTRIDD